MLRLLTQQLHTVSENLHDSTVDLVLVFVGTASDFTFNVQFIAFLDVFLRCFRQSSPQYDVMPLRAVGHLRTVLQRVSFLRGSK